MAHRHVSRIISRKMGGGARKDTADNPKRSRNKATRIQQEKHGLRCRRDQLSQETAEREKTSIGEAEKDIGIQGTGTKDSRLTVMI